MDIKTTFKSMGRVNTFGIAVIFQGRQVLLVMFSFLSWVVESRVSYIYMHSITIAGPTAYEVCSTLVSPS